MVVYVGFVKAEDARSFVPANLVKQVLRYMLVEAEAAQETAALVMAVLAAAVTETLAPRV